MRRLSGWGRNSWADCELVEPEDSREVAQAVDPAGTIARGLGRSYGDQAVCSHRRVIGTGRLDRYRSFDDATGTLVCEAGATLEGIIQTFGPRGWFPRITPGTKLVTVGGCIANDVHGKAHHAQGSFNTCVKSMRVLLARGDVVTASPTENADLFWGSFGGLGLLGIILEATITLRRITTTYFRQKAIVCDSLEALLDATDEHGGEAAYSVATIDPGATGARLGRGVLTVGDHAALEELPPNLAKAPLRLGRPSPLVVPVELPGFALNPLTAGILNQLIRVVLTRAATLSHYESFFYPLDAVGEWNRAYGPRGFTQYQFVVPLSGGRRAMRRLLEAIVSSGQLPFLNVLKRLGREGRGPLSFPFEGYTLAIDFPIRDGTAELTHRLDQMVLDAGGRVYLGKDSFLRPESLRRMYPRLDEWLRVKAKYDEASVFQSDLAHRLQLCAS